MLINKKSGVIVENAKEAFEIYRLFFEGDLPIGHHYPSFDQGFAIYKQIKQIVKS